MINCLIFYFLFAGFVQKWIIPRGENFCPTKIHTIDSDRDGKTEIVFTIYDQWPSYLHFYEFCFPSSWEKDSFLFPSYVADVWDSGDFDNDGYYDLIFQFHVENPWADGIMIFESSDSFSYPIHKVWADTVGQASLVPIMVFDVDRDGLPEIFNNNGGVIRIGYGYMKHLGITIMTQFAHLVR